MLDRMPAVPRIFGLLLALACADAKGARVEQAPSSVKGPPLEVNGSQLTRIAPRLLREPDAPPADDPALRRAYGPAEMKLGSCTQRASDGTITGSKCPSGCAVFGPYVDVPSQSDVHVEWEIHAVDALTLSSDIVSNATLTHAQLEPQALAAGETRKLGYRVHLSQGVKALEARVWVSSDKPAGFQIKNLSMTVL